MDRQRVVFSQSEKLDYFIKRVTELANSDEAKIRAELRADKEAFFEQSEKLLLEELEVFAQENRAKAQTEMEHQRSKLALERKYELLRIREGFSKDLQTRLTKSIKQFTQTNEYRLFLQQLAQKVTAINIVGEGTIYLAPFDIKYADDIRAHLQNVNGKAPNILESKSIKLGGLYYSNGKVSVNETLDNRVNSALAEINLDDVI